MNANLARSIDGKQWLTASRSRVRGLQPRMLIVLATLGSWALALGAGHRWW